jgi:hydrogenase/urease accessory protein HupE
MLNSVGFILGFSIVFIALGAISTGVGQLLAQYKSTLARLAGDDNYRLSSPFQCKRPVETVSTIT